MGGGLPVANGPELPSMSCKVKVRFSPSQVSRSCFIRHP